MKQNFELTINGASYEWPTKNITGSELRKLGNIANNSTLYYKVQGKDEQIHDSEVVDLGRIGIEHFYSIPDDPVYKFKLNGESYTWNSRFITGSQLRQLGKIAGDDELYLKEEQKDLLIPHDMRVDLAPEGIEEFYSKKVNHLVKIYVTVKGNTKTVEISKGIHSVTEIKEKGDVPQAFELEQKIDGKLVPLNDNASVTIEGCEEFIGHVRDGSSS